MHSFARFALSSLALLTTLTAACASSTAVHPASPCPGGTCTLTVQNDAATTLAVRFADTTGKQGLLGLVAPRAVRVFKLQWMQATGVRLYVMTRDNELFDADIALERVRPTQVHFPSDFTPADDIVLPTATGTARAKP